ncbi:H-type lectin domain-containing protein [Marivivens aquimaris]|uniref:H-type lectin domain-containing protein n=1 Tax=Marivivens aquimaris TaxID=2774876 RepID=UPI00187F3358|nr:H-type lectin domain-containing protein [Marivivens aquimaris]
MLKLENHLIGVDQGDVVLFSDFDTDGDMWTGEGPRLTRFPVTFRKAYRKLPAVQAWVSMLDMSNQSNARIDVQVENINSEGCEIVFRTWGDTRIARARAAWMSIGELKHEDDWDIE